MRLVIQSRHLNTHHLEHLQSFFTDSTAQQLSDSAYAFNQVSLNEHIKTYCNDQQLDYAFVDDTLNFDTVGLVVMDMDSTLINIECIDEIADMLGIKPQIAEITERTMRGELEFADSLRERVSLLKGLDQAALNKVYDERLQLNPGAEAMMAGLQQHGIKTLLVSGGFTFFTERLKQRIGLDHAHANTLEIIDGKLTGKILGDILDAQAKANWLLTIKSTLAAGKNKVIAMGDGANDLKMMAVADAGIAYHAKLLVQQQARYAFNHSGLDGLLNLLNKVK